jgi:Sulfotransferase family
VSRVDDIDGTILYVAGMGRSGSTLLGRAFGHHERVFYAGEVALLPSWIAHDWPCLCGEPISKCSFWSSVMSAMPRRLDGAAARSLDAAIGRAPMRFLPFLLSDRIAPRYRVLGRSGPDVSLRLRELYRAIASVSGAEIIVDSSKSPFFGYLLEDLPFGLRLLHLMREPRANVYSVARNARAKNEAAGSSFTSLIRAAEWSAWHHTIDRLWGDHDGQYIRVRYEDFVSRPSASLDRVAEFLGIAPVWSRNPAVRDVDGRQTLFLGGEHAIGGNPRRARTSTVTIYEDRSHLDLSRAAGAGIDIITTRIRRRLYLDPGDQPRRPP